MPMPRGAVPIDRRSARHAVFQLLRDWIEDAVLEPGEVIKDSDIAARLGVSRTPVREALQMLESHGAVEMLPGRVTRVTDVSPGDAEQLYAPLGALMAAAAEIATQRASEQDIAKMVKHNERLRAALDEGDPVSARDSDQRFHAVCLTVASNPYLDKAIEPLLLHARRLEALYFRREGPARTSYEEHKRIIQLVSSGDAAGVAELVRQNFKRFWDPSGSDTRKREQPTAPRAYPPATSTRPADATPPRA